MGGQPVPLDEWSSKKLRKVIVNFSKGVYVNGEGANYAVQVEDGFDALLLAHACLVHVDEQTLDYILDYSRASEDEKKLLRMQLDFAIEDAEKHVFRAPPVRGRASPPVKDLSRHTPKHLVGMELTARMLAKRYNSVEDRIHSNINSIADWNRYVLGLTEGFYKTKGEVFRTHHVARRRHYRRIKKSNFLAGHKGPTRTLPKYLEKELKRAGKLSY